MEFFNLGFGYHFVIRGADEFLLRDDFVHVAGKRNHHFRLRFYTLFNEFGGRFKNRAGLHFGNFGIGYTQADTAVPHHRVDFVQPGGAFFKYSHCNAQCFGQFRLLFGQSRHKFVERRVHQADGYTIARHSLHSSLDFLFHIREKFFYRGFAFGLVAGENHFAQNKERFFGVFTVEHMFNAEKADALRTEFAGIYGIFFRICVGAHFQGAHFVAQG